MTNPTQKKTKAKAKPEEEETLCLEKADQLPEQKKNPKREDKKEDKKKAGRPSLYKDEELMTKLLDAIKDGLSHAKACDLVGISPASLSAWQQVPEISERIKKAMAEGELYHLQRIKKGVSGWQSSAWFLERRYKSEWAALKETKQEEKEIKVTFEDFDSSKKKEEVSGDE